LSFLVQVLRWNQQVEPRAAVFDFFPGYPDLASFPRRAWLRALRESLRQAPDRAFGYPDPRGAPELRRALGDVIAIAADRARVLALGAAQ